MNKEATLLNRHHKKAILFCFIGIFLFSAGIGVGLLLQPKTYDAQSCYAANPAHEYLTGSAA